MNGIKCCGQKSLRRKYLMWLKRRKETIKWLKNFFMYGVCVYVCMHIYIYLYKTWNILYCSFYIHFSNFMNNMSHLNSTRRENTAAFPKKIKQEFSLWEEKSLLCKIKMTCYQHSEGQESNLLAPHRNSDPWNHPAYGSPPGKSLLTNLWRLVFCSSFKQSWWGISTDEDCLVLRLSKLKTASHDPTLYLLLVPSKCPYPYKLSLVFGSLWILSCRKPRTLTWHSSLRISDGPRMGHFPLP